jgi:hypothetical protein
MALAFHLSIMAISYCLTLEVEIQITSLLYFYPSKRIKVHEANIQQHRAADVIFSKPYQ